MSEFFGYAGVAICVAFTLLIALFFWQFWPIGTEAVTIGNETFSCTHYNGDYQHSAFIGGVIQPSCVRTTAYTNGHTVTCVGNYCNLEAKK
jgi:hypothetical protein